jgi:hypothetical protein
VAKYEDLNLKDLEKYSQPLDEIPLEVPQAKRPSIVERLLGTQSLMERTGFFTPEFDYTGVSDTITRRGAHLSVSQNLAKINFVKGTSGGMQNRIASLMYWTRRGAQQKTQASGAVTSSPSSSAPGSAASAVNNLQANPYDFEGSQLQRTSRLIASIPPITGGRQVFPLPEGYNPGQSFPPPVQPVPEQPAPSQSQPVPSPAPTPKPPEQPKSNFLPSIIDPSILNQPPIDWGKVYNANPGAPSTVTPSIGGASSQSVWQFLFNPEELQLDSGPDYNRAETWGVSDPANSGQPLSWKSNKNRKLIFGKVLLTGYVIGKRVDSLERGLQQLFMARDGENGDDGPPVLEFVWGARVFGPCVIQNIRVRERAWDAGALVNAEVSFELEQVPEWTINDGFVDIARPGRMPLVNDPLLPRSGVGVPAAPGTQGGSTNTTTAPANQPGGGTANPKKLSSTNCNALNSDSRAWQDMGGLANKNKSGLASARVALIPFFNFPVPVPPGSQSFQDTYPGNRDKYSKLLEKATSNSFYGSGVNSNTIGSECFNLSSAWSTSGTIPERQKRNSISNDTLIKCSTKIKNAIDSVYNSNQCKNFTIEQGFQGPAIR